MTSAEFAKLINNPTFNKATGWWQGRCPAHDDKSPSFGWRDGGKRITIKCLAGCSDAAILSALGLTKPNLFFEQPKKPGKTSGGGSAPSAVATYEYRDEHGALLFQVLRYADKTFKQRKPDGAGGWIWKKGAPAVFQLDKIQGEKAVAVVEGEKDALRLTAAGILATTCAMGAGKWGDEHTSQLKAAGVRTVYIFPDNDPAGAAHAEQVRASCTSAGLVPCVMHLPDLPPKGDVSDWLDAGHNIDGIQLLIHAVMVASRECLDVLPEYEPSLKCDDHAELGERPQIVVGAQGLAETADLAWAALIKGQNTAPLYKQGDALVRVAKDMKTGAPCLRVLNADRLRLSLARAADWVTGKGKPAVPPMATVDVMMADEEPPLPGLDRIVITPVFTADGRLLNTPGYDEASRLLYLPAPGLIVSAVPTKPNTEDVIYAKDLLIDIFHDFPFETDSDRAAALALLLTNPARSLVTGGVPLTILEKPEAGTGASLLVDAIGMVMTGQVLAKIPEAGTEEEWRKRITACLLYSPAYVVLDNLRRRLDSGALAAVLTSGIWQDRLLGVSRTVTLYVECIWIGTANNPQFSKEMSRRVVSCRMDAKMERPWDRPRAGFRHPDLLGWIGAHRGELIWASLVLVQNWLALGRPAGSAQLGSFESWAQTLGGILDAAGIPGLLSNAADFYTRADDESRPWRSFLAGWWREYQSTPCLSKDLLTLALDTLEIDAKSEGAQKIRLGKMLKRKVGTRFTIGDGLIVAVCRDEDLHDKIMRWSLQKVDDSPHSPQDSPPYKHKENNASRVVQVVAGSVSLMREGGGVDSGDTESEAMRAPENLSGRIVTRNSPQLLALPATGEPSATPKRPITEADWHRGTRIIDPDDPANDLEPSEEELAEAEARARPAGRRP